MDFLSALFKAITEVCSFWRQKDAEKNTAAMLAAKQLAEEQAAKDKTNQAIATGDLKELRNEISH